MSKRNYKHESRIVRVNPNTVRIGGGAYATLRNAEQKQSDKQKQTETQQKTSKTESITPENAERRKLIESIKESIKRTHYWWMDLYYAYDDYKITETEYFEIAKFAIDLYPSQMNRVRVDKLSANNYYEVCKVMAQHGVFSNIKCELLQQAQINGVKNSVYDIMVIALNSCDTPESQKLVQQAIYKMLDSLDIKPIETLTERAQRINRDRIRGS